MTQMTVTRAGYIAGLRELADVLETYQTIPLPFPGRVAAITIDFLGLNETPQQWEAMQADRALAASLLPCQFTGHTRGVYSILAGRLGGPGGLQIELAAFAEGPARFCSRCGTELPGHTAGCAAKPGVVGEAATIEPEQMPDGAL